MTITYPWRCHFCSVSNPTGTSTCSSCGRPAVASANDIYAASGVTEPPTAEMEYAGFWRRFGAFWADFIVLLPLIGITYIGGEYSRLNQIYWFIPGLLFGLWYHVYLVVRYGGTPGKLILNLRIAMVDGSPVTPKAAMLRYMVLLVLAQVMTIGLIMASLEMTDEEYFSLSYMARAKRMMELAPPWYQFVNVVMQIWTWSEFVTMLFNKKRRAIHDFMAGTVVLIGRQPNPVMQPTGQEAAGG